MKICEWTSTCITTYTGQQLIQILSLHWANWAMFWDDFETLQCEIYLIETFRFHPEMTEWLWVAIPLQQITWELSPLSFIGSRTRCTQSKALETKSMVSMLHETLATIHKAQAMKTCEMDCYIFISVWNWCSDLHRVEKGPMVEVVDAQFALIAYLYMTWTRYRVRSMWSSVRAEWTAIGILCS